MLTAIKSFDFCPRLHFPGAQRSSPKDPRLHHRGVDEEVSDLSSCLIFPGRDCRILFSWVELKDNCKLSSVLGRISFFLGRIFECLFIWAEFLRHIFRISFFRAEMSKFYFLWKNCWICFRFCIEFSGIPTCTLMSLGMFSRSSCS